MVCRKSGQRNPKRLFAAITDITTRTKINNKKIINDYRDVASNSVSATKMLKTEKRIFILGAGFSYHKTKILAKDYIEAIKKLSNKNSKRLEYNPERPAKRVMEFLKREEFSRQCDIELLFSNIENVCNRKGQSYPFRSSLNELTSVKDDLRFVLRVIDPNAGMIKEKNKEFINNNINIEVCEDKFEDWISQKCSFLPVRQAGCSTINS